MSKAEQLIAEQYKSEPTALQAEKVIGHQAINPVECICDCDGDCGDCDA